MPKALVCSQPETADHAQLYEILVRELTDFVVVLMDPAGCIVSCNPGVERVLGYSEAEWIGQSAEVIFTPEDRARGGPEEELTKAAREGRLADVRWYLRKNGERLFVESTMVALKDSGGTLLGFSKVMRDVTERKQAEEALRTNEERFRALVTASSDALYRMNHDWTEMRQLGGGGFISDTDSPTKGWLQQYIHPDDQPGVLEAIRTAVRSKSLFELEHRVRRVDGTIGWTHSRAVPLLNAKGEITEWFGAATDVTEQKAGEIERERLIMELARSNEDLSQFAHIVSHDLRTPIRSIKSFGQLLARRFENKLDSTTQQYLQYIQNSTESMNLLIETLLGYALAGQETMSLKLVPLDTILDAVLISLRPVIEETGAKIESQPLPVVSGDRTLLEQLFHNLMANAIKYRKLEQAPCISVRAQSYPDLWMISFTDNGQGIDPRYHQQIFAPLKRLHGTEIEGTGIGLAICKRIVERHGGRIWVESRAGQGATFCFTLPQHPARYLH